MAVANPQLRDLSAKDRNLLESWLAEFEQSWQPGLLASRVSQLPPPASPLRLLTLVEMVKIDLEYQWKGGGRPVVEAYLQDYPELGTPETVPVELVWAEYEVRRQFGDQADLAHFAERFPQQAEGLRELILHPSEEVYDSLPVQESRDTDQPGSSRPSAEDVLCLPSDLPEQFGRYRIRKKLGRGGMGSVYLAHDNQLDRDVALKVPHFAPEDGPDVLERFQREARITATLQHPNICPVHEVGVIDGIHYLTMDYLEGKKLSEFIQTEKPLPQRSVAAVVRKLALALQEAHARGIIHRDLKPSNIIINQRKEPVIIDFGLARRVRKEDVRLTKSGTPVGTPAYMPPEQIGSRSEDMGPRCDIYSLGVLLYELLTKKLPFPGDMMAVMGKILTQQPQPPSVHRADLDPRLETICLKAMAKKADDRYASMAELAATLTDYLRQECKPSRPQHSDSPVIPQEAGVKESPAGRASPVHQPLAKSAASPQPHPVRSWRQKARGDWWKHIPRWGRIAAAGLVAALLGSVVLYVATDEGTIKIEVDDPNVAVHVDGKEIRIENLGEPITFRTGKHELIAKRGDMEVHTQKFSIRRGKNDPLTVTLLREANQKPAVPRRPMQAAEPKPQGQGLCPADALRRDQIPPYELKVAGKGNPQHAPPELVAILGNSRMQHWNIVTAVAFSPDRKTLATGSCDRTAKIWDIASGDQLCSFEGHSDVIRGVAFSLDGKTLASASNDGTVKLWEIATGNVRTLTPRGGQVHCIGFSPNGKMLAAGLDDKTARIWDAATGQQLHSLEGHKGEVFSVAFSPKHDILATGSRDGTVRIWNVATGKSLPPLPEGHEGGVFAVAFSPDGNRFASGGRDGTRKLWGVGKWQVLHSKPGHDGGWDGGAKKVAFSPDGCLLASSSYPGAVFLCDATTGGEIHKLLPITWLFALAFSPDSHTLAIGNWDSAVRLWDVTAEEPRPPPADSMNHRMAVSPNGRTVASASPGRKVRIWDIATGKIQQVLAPQDVLALAYSPDGQTLAVGSNDGKINLWEVATGKILHNFDGHTAAVRGLAFSPNGKTLASASDDTTLKLWDVATGRETKPLQGHGTPVHSVAYHPEGRMLASGGEDGTIKLWDVETGKEWPLGKQNGEVVSLAFHRDGKMLASASWGTVQLWDLATGQTRHTLEHPPRVESVAFSPDGLTVATASEDGKVRLWNPRTGLEQRTLELGPSGGHIWKVAFTPEGRHLVTANRNGTIYVLRLAAVGGASTGKETSR
jgi:WD40 repeat protein/serine/threonine protein kinase